MAKPPESTPHSDIDGIHQDERPNTDVAAERDEAAGELHRAGKEDAARPLHSNDRKNRDDRS